jgi:hypothetical protein
MVDRTMGRQWSLEALGGGVLALAAFIEVID